MTALLQIIVAHTLTDWHWGGEVMLTTEAYGPPVWQPFPEGSSMYEPQPLLGIYLTVALTIAIIAIGFLVWGNGRNKE